MTAALPRLGPVRHVQAGPLDVGYIDTGPGNGDPVLLLHGFPYDVHSYVDVIPQLTSQGRRVIVPWLRGHGPTRFLDPAAPRSGQQAALGADVIALLDALGIERAVLAGYDWGARAACVAAALRPDRCAGLVSVTGYLIQNLATAADPLPAELEAGFWYFFYFGTERGRRGLTANRRGIARVIWTRNSPRWSFDEAELDRAAEAFGNDDYVDVVIHSYRHRLGLAPGDPAFEEWEQRLAAQPVIAVPTITLDGQADGNFPATDGHGYAPHFSGPWAHRQVPAAGHNLPREQPAAFTRAVLDVTSLAPSV